MSLALSSSVTAIGPALQTGFLASGGTPAYAYSVLAGGAGGTINSSTGVYHSPVVINTDPAKAYDTIQVTDSLGATATLQILVGNALALFCDIIQNYLGLSNGRVYLWDQKLMQPTDSSLYVAVGIVTSKPFGNTNRLDGSGSGLNAVQSVNMLDTLSLDIISRGPEARDRKGEVILALNSIYAQAQQELNSFKIGQLPAGAQFINLSEIDGAAIPYRFRISVNLQYFVTNVRAAPYYNDFAPVTVTTES